MSTLDWRAVRALFDTICDLPAKQRQEVIDASGLGPQGLALLQSMLDADARSDIGENVHAHAPQVIEAMAQDSRIGSLVGAWRIEALIGVGGMGRVYRAHREDGCYEGLAAIKFVAEAANPGFFAHERHVLARLTHPGIARLLDAGEDAHGQPYLVMEYIAGSSIRDHCRANGDDARARIAVVRAAAQAIAHAHAQLVLHRDLKPANLMVDTHGQVKVLDFGVAKLLDRTSADPQQTAARYFTLRYAAPEQIAGEPTGTGVDIYALALILYELLADEHPFAAQPQTGRSLAERVLAGDATPLRRCLASRNDPMLAGFAPDRARDLEAVLARALSRDPSARYASVMEFADELGRVLDDLPVLARAGTAAATLARLARRHRVAMALGTFALLSLAVLSLVALWQAERAARERDLSQHEAVRAERIADFLTGLFEASQPLRNQGREPSARDLLDSGRAQLEKETELDGELRVRLQAVIADSYRALGHYDEAEALLKAALAVDTTPPEGSRRKAELLLQLGRVHNFQSRWNDAERVLRLGLESLRGTADGLLIAGLQRQLAVCLINQERPQDAEAAAQSALAHLNGLQPVPVHEVIDTEMLLATIAYSLGDLPSAQAAYARIVQAQRADTEQAGLVTSLNNLAAIELRLDRLDESIAHYRESIALARARYGARNREVALPLVGLGSALRAAGDRESALNALRESQSIYADWAGTAHPETAYASLLLAEMLWLEGDIGAASAALKGVTTILAADGAQSIKACRARLLELALVDPDDTAADPREDSIACLSTPQAPANLRLMARWVALSRGLGDDDLETLQREAAALVPRDGALQRAISLGPAGRRRETE